MEQINRRSMLRWLGIGTAIGAVPVAAAAEALLPRKVEERKKPEFARVEDHMHLYGFGPQIPTIIISNGLDPNNEQHRTIGLRVTKDGRMAIQENGEWKFACQG